MTHIESEWQYDRTNSRGEKKFRRNTNEKLDDVIKFLDDNDITYEYKAGAKMFWIHEDQTYQYFYTTGRWGVPRGTTVIPPKHYHSKGIKDFLTKYVNREDKNEG